MQQLRFDSRLLLAGLFVVSLVGACRSDSVPAPPSPERPSTGGSGGRGGRGGAGAGGSGMAGSGMAGSGMAGGAGGGGMAGGAGGGGPAGDAAKPMTDAPAAEGGGGADGAADMRTDGRSDATADSPGPTDMAPPRDAAAGDALPRNLANGAACQMNVQCRSGFCIDGVCCAMNCNNPCMGCAMATTGQPNGRCAVRTGMVGMKCGRGCQQFPGRALLVVVDRVCTAAGQCDFPQIPQNPDYCADEDPCTTINCVQDSAISARCARTSACTGNACCCVAGTSRMCMNRNSCTSQGRACM